MADTNITVTVAGGVFTYVPPSPLTITPNSKLRWKCAQGPISIFFKDNRTPMANGAQVLSADTGDLTKKLQVKDVANGNPPYRYSVAVMIANAISTDDPDIIIDDGLGGGPGRAAKKKAKPAKKKAKPAKKKARKSR